MSKIDAKTAVYGIVGNPVEHSLSPLLQSALFDAAGINGIYAAFGVKNSLAQAIAGAHALGIRGLNVTAPYKRDVITLLSGIDENAHEVGAVNTLKYTDNGYKGYNTDVYGVLKTFQKHGVSFEKDALVILGAGGGANACAFAGAMHGAKRIYIANRSNNNREALATRIKRYYNDIEVFPIGYGELGNLDGGFFILQATSVGMGCAASPIEDLSVIEKSSGVIDIIYSPLKTKILCDAEEFGKIAVNGLDMLVFQAVSAFEIWNGITADDESISRAFDLLKAFLEH